ncbi:uncharacterized protein LOC114378756 [Glycine soja]|uniref:uncharacterized protein LOC114378756 n=1 Tax=Glycine soja TaxID=3848 RepID=UPI00103BAA39|nr:uncharacterized protein LOC114378756 [Glycine soja]
MSSALGDAEVSWEMQPATNTASGILCMWCEKSFRLQRKVTGNGFILLVGEWTREEQQVNIVTIYSPCDIHNKRLLWDAMRQLKEAAPGGLWCILGDFNSIRDTNERFGCGQRPSTDSSMTEFNEWIDDMEVLEIPCVGRKFTWYKSNGASRRRLDRFLVSPEWLGRWLASFQTTLARNFSYHCPILLRSKAVDWGPKPFRVLDCWLSDNSFKELVHQCWTSHQQPSWGGYVLKEKFEIKKEDEDLEQGEKARSRWIKEGDCNSCYFHLLMSANRRNNSIKGVMLDGTWIDEPQKVKEEEEEVRQAIWDCGSERCPGPDGFNFKFIKKFWHLFKPDILHFLDEFHANGVFPRGGNASFLALIPKVLDPHTLNDYRHISLRGCMYKIVAKLLAKRLKVVMPFIINETQYAFIEGRHLLHSALIANEVIDEAKRSNKSCLIFKVDYEKAYDSVSWNFLMYMMRRMGFSPKWIKWIEGCVKSASISVLVNGSPTIEFIPQRGLRQGDPLAPFLFNIAAEGLNGLMRRAVEYNLYKPFLVSANRVPINILQYADDTIFFGEAAKENVEAIKVILRSFELVSGLRINFSKIYFGVFGVTDQWKQEAANYLHCSLLAFPFVYLGIPIGANPRVPQSVVDKLVKIKCTFLWGGGSDQKKISWIRWEKVCLPKERGGLGIKDINTFNMDLLGKWKWHLLQNQGELWAKVLESRYGGWRGLDDEARAANESTWWRDLKKATQQSYQGRAIHAGFRWKVGVGDRIKFWEDRWLCQETSLAKKYPRLYSISLQQQ